MTKTKQPWRVRVAFILMIIGVLAYGTRLPIDEYDSISWQEDADYVRHLIVDPDGYKSNMESVDTVDALRVYKVKGKKGYERHRLRALFKEERVFETIKKDDIRPFVLAAQKRTNADGDEVQEGCGRADYNEREIDWYHVVMFDNTFKRAGRFIARVCESRGKEYMEILVFDKNTDETISYYNKLMIPAFKDRNILKETR